MFEKASRFMGVSRSRNKWLARVKGKPGGTYESEEEAAKAVNALCDEQGIPHKNPGIGTREIKRGVTLASFQ